MEPLDIEAAPLGGASEAPLAIQFEEAETVAGLTTLRSLDDGAHVPLGIDLLDSMADEKRHDLRELTFV